ncbi:MAG: amidohydrolase family protein [Candidatus Heimdallarchaeota archaeon]|nr:amidohydrolase family protein [Candidatus Heimdallarchaeota archaeon]
MTVIFARAKFLIPMTQSNGLLDRIEDGYILTGERILEVGQFSEEIGQRIIKTYGNNLKIIGNDVNNATFKDLIMNNAVLLPGFIKGHGHDHESVLIGVAKDEPLTSWLDKAVNHFTGMLHEQEAELTEQFGKSPYLVAYLKARMDDIQFGITSALTHHCNFNKYHADELVEANEQAGTRLYIAVGSQDRNYDSRILDTPDEAVARLDAYERKHGDKSRSIIIPGPDQLFSNGPELLKALKKWADEHNKLIHIHSSEEPNTTKWFTEKYGMTPVEYAHSIGFLDENAILAHQVNSTDNDLNLLQKTGTKIIHNPLANTILGSGMPRIMEMMAMGIPLAISTDGSGSADNQNILAAARLASQYQKAFNKDAKVMKAEDVLLRITKIPADILRLNAGTLEAGKDGDFILFDLNKPNMIPTRKETVVENLIWASSGNEIRDVVANGKLLLENYAFLTLEYESVISDILKLADLFEKYKEGKEVALETGIKG